MFTTYSFNGGGSTLKQLITSGPHEMKTFCQRIRKNFKWLGENRITKVKFTLIKLLKNLIDDLAKLVKPNKSISNLRF